MKTIRLLLASIFAVAALAIGGTAALAQTSTQSTTVTLSVPTSITLSGLAATYSQSLVAGSATSLFMGTAAAPLTVNTNDALGYHLTIAAGAANFVGSGTNVIPVGDDQVLFCTNPAGSGCGGAVLLSTTAQQIRNTSASGSDNFALLNSITIPATQAADTYTGSVSLVATAN